MAESREGPADTLTADGGPRPERASEVAVGDVLEGRYELLEELGRGAYGVVFRAHDRTAEVDVAVKVLARSRRLSTVATERLRRELRAAWTVTHPGVVRIHDLITSGDQLALSMELVVGETLAARLARDGKLGVPALIALANDLASALAAAHAGGITHRDLKPSNLMIRASTGRVVITDLGLSRMSGFAPLESGGGSASESIELTESGELLGTPAFMAPEQLEGRADIGPAADIYAVGLVLFEAATATRPHPQKVLSELIKARLGDPITHIAELRADLPTALARLIDDCLIIDPGQRIADGDALRRRLAELEQRSRPTRWIVPLAVGLVAAVVAGIALQRRHDEPTRRTPVASIAPDAATVVEPPHTSAVTKLGDDACAYSPAFADDNTVVFDLTRGQADDLFRISTSGGDPVRLTEGGGWEWRAQHGRRAGEVIYLRYPATEGGPSSISYFDTTTGQDSIAFNVEATDATLANDTIFYATHNGHELHRVRGGHDELVPGFPTEVAFIELAISPDASMVATMGVDDDGVMRVCTIPLEHPAATCFVVDYAARPAFGRDGRALYYATRAGIRRRIVATGEDSMFLAGEVARGGLAVSPDGRRLAYSNCGAVSRILDVSASPPKVIVDGPSASMPALAADGSLAYVRTDGTAHVLVLRRPDGTETQLTSASLGPVSTVSAPAFSRNSQMIAFSVGAPHPGLYTTIVKPGSPLEHATDQVGDVDPAFANDDQLMYTHLVASKPAHSYILSADGGTPKPIPGTWSVIGVDRDSGDALLAGNEYHWWSPTTGKLRPGPRQQVHGVTQMMVSPSGNWLLMQAGASGQGIWRQSLRPLKDPEHVYDVPQTAGLGAIDDTGHPLIPVQAWSGDVFVAVAPGGSTF